MPLTNAVPAGIEYHCKPDPVACRTCPFEPAEPPTIILPPTAKLAAMPTPPEANIDWPTVVLILDAVLTASKAPNFNVS